MLSNGMVSMYVISAGMSARSPVVVPVMTLGVAQSPSYPIVPSGSSIDPGATWIGSSDPSKPVSVWYPVA